MLSKAFRDAICSDGPGYSGRGTKENPLSLDGLKASEMENFLMVLSLRCEIFLQVSELHDDESFH